MFRTAQRARRQRFNRKRNQRYLGTEQLEKRMLLANIVVDNADDWGPGSLRQAILDANASVGVVDTIEFAIPGAGPHTINVGSSGRGSLPGIEDPVVIDGYSQGGNTVGDATDDAWENTNPVGEGLNTGIRIELDGTSAPGGANGIQILAGGGGSTVRGLSIGNFDGDGILAAGTGNRISGNFLGTAADGVTPRPNNSGVRLTGSGTLVGGDSPADRNLISGNTNHGVYVLGGSGNFVEGNMIGTSPTGTAAVANGANGVLIQNSPNNTIGGTEAGAGNLLSGNGTNGVTIILAPSTGTVIQGNRIGTDVTGTQDLGNGIFGVFAFEGIDTVIGGESSGAGNLISGNDNHGIFLEGGSNNAIVAGNRIGTSADGTQAIGNGGDGIQLQESSKARIGGQTAAAGNTVSANALNGIVIGNTTETSVQNNRLGTDPTGTQDLGNGFSGILIVDSSNSTIGGSASTGNVIAFNDLIGIRMFGDSATGNTIRSNSIFDNDGLGIDFNENGPDSPQTADPGVGPNSLQNFPVIDSVIDNGTSTTIEGRLTSRANRAYRVEFFSNATLDPTFFGEGKTPLGMIDVSTDGFGAVDFSATVAAAPAGEAFITATATDLQTGDTSEFSGVPGATSYEVTSTADSGPGTLRNAINNANDQPGQQSITFAIPADDPGHVYYRNDNVPGQVTLANVTGTTAATDANIADIDPDHPYSWWTITPGSVLPSIAEAVVIDAYTQSGAVENTNEVGQGLNSVLRVEINGQGAGDVPQGMLRLQTDGSTVRGLVINRTIGPKIRLENPPDIPQGNTILEGNYVGPDVSGTRSFAPPAPTGFVPDQDGIFIKGSINNLIGGTDPTARNLISGNSSDAGIHLQGMPKTDDNNRIEGNLIGTDRAGSRALGNLVGINTGRGTRIGGADPETRNVISGNGTGVSLQSRLSTVRNNDIGTDASGKYPLGNTGAGVYVPLNSGDNQIMTNTIAYNTSGVVVDSGDAVGNGNLINRNRIFANLAGGIDIGAAVNDIPPQSDPPDSDVGPNARQNFPVLTLVELDSGGTRIEGTLQSTPNSGFRIEFFSNSVRDFAYPGAARYSQGETVIGELLVSTDAAGNANFFVDVGALPTDQPYVTATATDITNDGSGPRNNTSQFSPVFPLGGPSVTVTNTSNAGIGSLREAIINANLIPGLQTIDFNIPADDPGHLYYQDDGVAGQVSLLKVAVTTEADDINIVDIDPDWPHSWFSIQPTEALPELADQVVINGYTQPGSQFNTHAAPGGLNTVLKVEVSGAQLLGGELALTDAAPGVATQRLSYGGSGEGQEHLDEFALFNFTVGGDAFLFGDSSVSRVEGLAINLSPGNGITFNNFGGNSVAGSFLGTDVSGTLDLGNQAIGVVAAGDFNRIGTVAAAERNLISGNDLHGVGLVGTAFDLLSGNVIGADRNVTQALANDQAGVRLFETTLVDVGRPVPGADNVLVADPAGGIVLTASPTGDSEVAIQQGLLPIIRSETLLSQRATFFLTGDVADFQDLLTTWDQVQATIDPVVVAGQALGNTFRGNSYLGTSPTAGLAIDLGADGVTVNDAGDIDNGPNALQDSPKLVAAVNDGTATRVSGSINSQPDNRYRLDFYTSAALHPTGFGPGEQMLGSLDVMTNRNGNVQFDFVTTKLVPPGHFITAVATRLYELDVDPLTPPVPLGTSEFSEGVVVTEADPDDVVAPTVITRDIIVPLDAAGQASITADQVDGGSVDNVGITRLVVVPSTFTVADVGPNTVTLTASDAAGNSASATAVVTVVDVTPPNVLTQNIVVELDATGNASITAEQVDNGSFDAAGIASRTVDPNAFDGSDLGANTVTLTLIDNHGNVATGNAVVTVVDLMPPTLTLPADITVNTDPGLASAVVTYAAATVADNLPGASVQQLAGLPSGAAFPLGTTLNTFEATDVAGNIVTAAFSVTVVDNEPPTVVTRDITVQLDASGNASITPEQVDAGSFDAAGIVERSVSPSTFNSDNLGPNTVLLTVSDANGNSAQATATVTVTQRTDQQPEVTVQDGVLVIVGSSDRDVIDVHEGSRNITVMVNGTKHVFRRRTVDQIVIDGRDGNDEITRRGRKRVDTLIDGGDGDDVITGGRGGETIFGGRGNDVIDGGRGDNLIFGGDGDDTITGGNGRDTISGGNGADVIDGGRRSDQIFGDAGDDELVGGSGSDIIDGGEGQDTLQGGSGRDLLFGGAGDDLILGGSGKDELHGGGGRNTLLGGSGVDLFFASLLDEIGDLQTFEKVIRE